VYSCVLGRGKKCYIFCLFIVEYEEDICVHTFYTFISVGGYNINL